MTNLEYVIVRRAHILREAAKMRPLTKGELHFLKLVLPVLERLAAREGS